MLYTKMNRFQLLLLVLFPFIAFSQRGKNNDFTVSIAELQVNAYTTLTANASTGASSITVQDATLSNAVLTLPLAPGDLILIVQMQGATMNVGVTPTAVWGGQYIVPFNHLMDWKEHQEKWGSVVNYNDAGKFEYAQVASVAGSTISFSCGLKNSYTTQGRTQVIRVPRFRNLTIQNNASISAPAWNGSVGGIVAIEVEEVLNLNGTNALITTTGKGFRGGQSNDNTTNGSSASTDPLAIGFTGSSSSFTGAEKGEGIVGFRDDYINTWMSLYGKGAAANAGGGGNNHNAGGGGGSNVGVGSYTGYGIPNPAFNAFWNLELIPIGGMTSPGGGRGGYSYSTSNQNEAVVGPNNDLWSGDKRRNEGGYGGHPLAYDPSRLFMGGGGGAGDQNFSSAPNQVGIGGNGGGIIALKVYGQITGSGRIEANGAQGGSSNPTNITTPGPTQKVGNDGAGGGGGGGSIFILSETTVPTTVQLNAQGGAGGNQAFFAGAFASAPTMEADGPGGGGAGGLITLSSNGGTSNVNGGQGGVTNSAHVTTFPHNGATGGGLGMVMTDQVFYDLEADGANLCGSANNSVTLEVTVNGTLPPASTVLWFNQPFGGSPIATGTSYTTPNLAATTTFYVGVCPGDFRIPVTVTIGENPIISGTPTISPETCAIADGSITNLTITGGTSPYSFSWNGQTTPTADLSAAPAGEYTLTVTGADGCSVSSSVYTIPGFDGPVISTTNMVITDADCNGQGGSIVGITQTNGVSFSWNGQAVASLDLLNAAPGSYTLTVTDANACAVSAGPFTVGQTPGPTIDASLVSTQPSLCGTNNGSISGITATGTGLVFTWNGVSSATPSATNLAPGSYTLVATDANGCTASAGPFVVADLAGPVLNESGVQLVQPTCGQTNGSITGLTFSGGQAPVVGAWNNQNASLNLTNLGPGSYFFTVIDANGCQSVSSTFVLSSTGGPVVDATVVQLTQPTCTGNDGAISGIVATGTNLTYSWNGVSGTSTLNNAAPGSYTLIVTDTNNCSTSVGPFVLNAPQEVLIASSTAQITQPTCGLNNGSISGLNITGQGPFTLSWTGTSASTLDLTNLSPGSYLLSVIAANNCTASYGPVVLNPSSGPTANFTFTPNPPSAGQSVQFTDASQGNPVTWGWSIGGELYTVQNPAHVFTENGTYVVVLSVTDNQGCTDEVSLPIVLSGDLIIPNVLTVNDDGINDVFQIANLLPNTQLLVVNRWGNEVYSTSNYLNDWKGQDGSGKFLSEGVYTYRIETPKNEVFHGFIHVYRK